MDITEKQDLINIYTEIFTTLISRYSEHFKKNDAEFINTKVSEIFPEFKNVKFQINSDIIPELILTLIDNHAIAFKIIEIMDYIYFLLCNILKNKNPGKDIDNEIYKQLKHIFNKNLDNRFSRVVIGLAGAPAHTTGIDGLDNRLGEGFPANSIFLIIGSSGTGKEILSYQFVSENAKKGASGIIFTSNLPVSSIKEYLSIKEDEIDKFYKLGRILFVDNYSWKIGRCSAGVCDSIATSDGTITDIAVALEKAIKQLKPRYVCLSVDILSEFLVEFGIKKVYSICETLFPMLRTNNATVLFLIEKGAASEDDLNVIKMLADGVIILREKEIGDNISLQLFIEKFRGRTRIYKWIPYTFKNERIILEL